MVKKQGFTLVEIMIAMTIVVFLAISMIGIFNVLQPVNKGRDSQRKKDLNRIKEAFEEYFNDKGTYPIDVNSWNIKSNCKSDSIFKPYLVPWPCDPNGTPYKIIVESKRFRILTNLENKNDDNIPKDWYERVDFVLSGLTKDDVNFGVSSSDINWYDVGPISKDCNKMVCLSNQTGGCGMASGGCTGNYCYYYDNSAPGSCTTKCRTACCGNDCD